MADHHRFFLDIDDEYIGVRVECPYTKIYERDVGPNVGHEGEHFLGSDVNTQRPCWPHHVESDADGNDAWVPDDAPQSECTYTDWADNVGLDEIVHGKCSVQLHGARWSWEDDYATIEVDDVVDDTVPNPLADARIVEPDD